MRKGLSMQSNVITVVLVFLCLLAGKLLSGPAPQDAQDPPPHFVLADPADVGLESKTLKIFTDKVQALVENGEAVGAIITLIKDRKIVLHEAFGWADKEFERPMRTDTICRMRSMTCLLYTSDAADDLA